MKTLMLLTLLVVLFSFDLHAEPKTYKLKVITYMGFGGEGPKFRREEVVTPIDGKEEPVAVKVFLDETNELRELRYVNDVGQWVYPDAKDPKTHGEVEKFFKLAVPEKKSEK